MLGLFLFILSLGYLPAQEYKFLFSGQDAGILWAVPFRIEVSLYFRPGTNTIDIEVTNLPSNRIADYGHWTPVESGLLGEVRLIPVVKDSNTETQRH